MYSRFRLIRKLWSAQFWWIIRKSTVCFMITRQSSNNTVVLSNKWIAAGLHCSNRHWFHKTHQKYTIRLVVLYNITIPEDPTVVPWTHAYRVKIVQQFFKYRTKPSSIGWSKKLLAVQKANNPNWRLKPQNTLFWWVCTPLYELRLPIDHHYLTIITRLVLKRTNEVAFL